MADYTLEECPHCGNDREEDTLYQCKDCAAFYCSLCLPRAFGSKCRQCGKESGDIFSFYKTIGWIESDKDDEDEDEDKDDDDE